jgi:DNA-binding ferritin-like protein (Dps family)
MGKEWKRDFDRAKKLQEQYDKELKELYPELKRYYH